MPANGEEALYMAIISESWLHTQPEPTGDAIFFHSISNFNLSLKNIKYQSILCQNDKSSYFANFSKYKINRTISFCIISNYAQS